MYLKQKADVREQVWRLHAAINAGDISMVKELLERQVFWESDLPFMVEHKNDQNHMRTPLLEAVEGGYLHLVEYLINNMNASATARDSQGNWAVHLAAEGDHISVIAYLVDKYPTMVEARNYDNATPLFVAASVGNLESVKLLYEYKGADCEARGQFYRTPLLQAIANNHLEIVEYLCQRGNASLVAAEQERAKNTAIHLAAELGHLRLVKFLLDFQPDLLEYKTQFNDTALNRAALKCRGDVVEFLVVNKSANVNNRGLLKRTPLIQAVSVASMPEQKVLETVRILFLTNITSDGVDLRAQDSVQGSMAIHFACENGAISVVDFLLQKDPQMLEMVNSLNETCLIRAIVGSQLEMVRFLLANRSANVEKRGNAERTPLMYASSRGELAIVRALLNYSAEINATDWPRGNMAHILAAAFGHIETVDFLLDLRPDLLEAKTALNDTAMNSAASGGSVEMVKALLRRGANVENRGYRGTTPLLRASGNGRMEVVRFLYLWGVNTSAVTDEDGDNALHLAATYNHVDVAEFLADRCPELLLQTNVNGETPKETALRSRNLQIALLFQSKMSELVTSTTVEPTTAPTTTPGVTSTISTTTTVSSLNTNGSTVATSRITYTKRNHSIEYEDITTIMAGSMISLTTPPLDTSTAGVETKLSTRFGTTSVETIKTNGTSTATKLAEITRKETTTRTQTLQRSTANSNSSVSIDSSIKTNLTGFSLSSSSTVPPSSTFANSNSSSSTTTATTPVLLVKQSLLLVPNKTSPTLISTSTKSQSTQMAILAENDG